jgi:DNA (cytosine-5)-methyltransferase 1
LRIDRILMENVREWRDWGPVGANGKPLRSRKGETYQAFLAALRSLNYRVEERVLNAADYGDATTRERLFILATRGRDPIRWPAPTHAAQPTLDGRAAWRPAKDVIDWSIPGDSIFARKRPLSPNTLRRIATGLRRINGLSLDPFIVPQFGEREGQKPRTHSIHKHMPAVTSHGAGALVQPFLVRLNNPDTRRSTDDRSRRVTRPLPTLTAKNGLGIVEPFLIPHQTFANHTVDRIDRPFRTITGNSADFALVEPFLSRYNGVDGAPHPVTRPMPTVTTKDRLALVMPVVVLDGAEYHLDIRFRMLQPHELAGAMGFPADYTFTGTREDRVRQIGNAVAVNLATALCRTLLTPLARTQTTRTLRPAAVA